MAETVATAPLVPPERRDQPSEETLAALVAKLFERNPRAVGRAISLVESGGPAQRELVRRVYAHTGRAKVIGNCVSNPAKPMRLCRRATFASLARINRSAVIANENP